MEDDIKRVMEKYFSFLFLRNSFFLALAEEVQSVFLFNHHKHFFEIQGHIVILSEEVVPLYHEVESNRHILFT